MKLYLLDYALFTLKFLTVAGSIGLLLMLIVQALRAHEPDKESIEINKINDKYETMRDAMEEALYDTKALKARHKARKLEDKKAETDGPSNDIDSKLFVLRFEGDIEASEVHALREAITAILIVAVPGDEIVLLLESAGGLVHHYGLAAAQLARLKTAGMKLTVCIDLVAASGGYLMACVADKIIAAPFAVVGSIGVIAQVPNIHRLLEKNDIDIEQHTAGEFKTTLTFLGKNTDKARKKFKQELTDTHTLFKAFVASYRPKLTLDEIATGEHWYASQAVDNGLVDELLTSDDYLLAKSHHHELFEVTYVIHETFKDKINHLLDNIFSKISMRLQGPIFKAK